MQTYWVLVRTEQGGSFRAMIQADNPFNAFQMAKSMYGRQLISEYAVPV